MKSSEGFWGLLKEKFNTNVLLVSTSIVAAFTFIPKIDFLSCFRPFDSIEKIIEALVSVGTVYLLIMLVIFLWKKFQKYRKYKPKKFFRTIYRHHDCIAIYYSSEIGEFTPCDRALPRYGISRDVIEKLDKNNIIQLVSGGCFSDQFTYSLTDKARKKLNRLKRIIVFIDSKIINKQKK